MKVSIRSSGGAQHPKRTFSAFWDALAIGRSLEAGFLLWEPGLFPVFLGPDGAGF